MEDMIFDYPAPRRDALRAALAAAYRADETRCVDELLRHADLPCELIQGIDGRARALVREAREHSAGSGVEGFLVEYRLTSQEGTALMCLAESLLRVPDARTEEALIEDKLGSADWHRHLGHSESLFVNASTWAFLLSGRLLEAKTRPQGGDLASTAGRLLGRASEPLIREAFTQAMRIIARQFIMGRTVEEGLARARVHLRQGYRLSFDMLGEAAHTQADAEDYLQRYRHAIEALRGHGSPGPGQGMDLSLKLSALDPRFEFAQRGAVMARLLPRLGKLARAARAAGISLTIDTEEAERLELTLDLLEALAGDPALTGWDGLGIAVQAYQKRALALIDHLVALARQHRRRVMVRLVKGAYWDAEIRRSQLGGLANYPVFTRKAATDVSYIACARRILDHTDALYPMFATHNAHTVATMLALSGERRDLEFQRLHGMGEALYRQILGPSTPCRIYAPCGGHRELLPYLVRRLLENGANTSFVNRIADPSVPVERIIADPIARLRGLQHKANPRIPLPAGLYAPGRRNSQGLDLSDEPALRSLTEALRFCAGQRWRAASIVDGQHKRGAARTVYDPADHRRAIGQVLDTDEQDLEAALGGATRAYPRWEATPVDQRAAHLERVADLLEAHRHELIYLCIREAGKTLADAVAEVREAVDYCRYYAACAREQLGPSIPLPSHSGRRLHYRGLGVFACISPWNLPLAIFSGQVAAALVAGNTVVAKPAEQTPLIAARAVALFHLAGIPCEALQLVIGDGAVGARLVADPRVGGVVFTGSVAAAHSIRSALGDARHGIAPLIAETGGQNAMIVDSTALLEQAVESILSSAFDSTGQRCSALRVLYLQEDIADPLIALLAGAMAELRIGDPASLATDVGPAIDAEARARLQTHRAWLQREGRLIYGCELPEATRHGTFFAPCAYEIDAIRQLTAEHFGPILHVIRYRAAGLERVVEEINATGYGLTFGIHSRIDATVEQVCARIQAGNRYVNRNMIGAVVGVQPFGGEGLSGTGPKAGGPHYLRHFTRQRASDGPGPLSPSAAPQGPFLPAGGGWSAASVVDGEIATGEALPIPAGAAPGTIIGRVVLADATQGQAALGASAATRQRCDQTPLGLRTEPLLAVARRLTERGEELALRYALEAGVSPAHAREIVDQAGALCRAWAAQARRELAAPLVLHGATGERNEYRLHNRGPFLCLALGPRDPAQLTGMLAAALAAGNAVVLLCQGGGWLTGQWLFQALRAAGVPGDMLHYLPGAGDCVLDTLLDDPRLAGVACLGETEKLHQIDAHLARREGPIIPFIAGHNALFINPENLYRYATARTLSVDTTAAGGNASLYAMDEGDPEDPQTA
jgi:RHH-type proline utilization regulon transcriptional repressor/proline dehydrogenase/delta 1-pyrroline-5-carboxylate dehydrogenase